MQYTFVVTTEDNLENYDMKGNKSINTALCNGKDVWKISSIPENTTAEQQVAFENLYINNLINNANKAFGGFSDLTGITLGETTTGEGPIAKITLDTDAAGYGWFIDSTPLINDEFLPTADANIWKAKAGSAAEGKMDMLSVLLHEYGHSLGLEHSTAASDAMAATLKPGERRLFTSEELAQLDRLRITFGAQLASLNSDPLNPSAPTGPLGPESSLLLGLSLARRRTAMDTGGG